MTHFDELGKLVDKYIDDQINQAKQPLVAANTGLSTQVTDLTTQVADLRKKIAEFSTVTPSVPTGWRLDWQDDFNTFDAAVWNADAASTYGSGNQHAQINTNRPENLRIENSALVIEARVENPPLKPSGTDPLASTYPNGRPYSAAHVNSSGKKTFTFGKTPIRFEVRAKLPVGPGFLPCPLWLRPTTGGSDGEIDLVESYNGDPKAIVLTAHQSYTVAPKHASKNVSLATPYTDWHTYAVEIDATAINYYIDGVATFKVDKVNLPQYATVYGVDRAWLMRITLGIGGSWVGNPTSATKFPAQMAIDWIKVYRKA
jgi:beta-glucanase (GH16 family)